MRCRWHPCTCSAPTPASSIGMFHALTPHNASQPLELLSRQINSIQANPITQGPADQPALFQHQHQLYLFFRQPSTCIAVAAQLNSNSGWRVLGQALCSPGGVSHASLITHSQQPYMLAIVQQQLRLYTAAQWPLRWTEASAELPAPQVSSASMWEGGDRLWLLAVPPRGQRGSRAALYWSGHPRGPWTEERCGPDSSMCPASVGRILRHGAMCCKYRTKFRTEGHQHLHPRHHYPVSRILAACISPCWHPSQSLAQLSHSLPVGCSQGTTPYHTVCRLGHESSPAAASDSLLTADSTLAPHTRLDASALGLPRPAQSPKPAWYSGGWSSAHRICLPDSGCTIAAAGRSLLPRHSFWSASWLMLVLLALIAMCLAGPSGHRLCQGSCWQSSSSRRHAKPGRRHSGDLRHADAAEAPPLPRRQQQQQQQPRAGPVRQWLRQPARCRAGLAAAAQKLAQKLTAWLERPCARRAVAALALGSAAATWGLAPGQSLLILGMLETCIGHISTRQASLRMLPAVPASRALGPMLQALPCSPAHDFQATRRGFQVITDAHLAARPSPPAPACRHHRPLLGCSTKPGIQQASPDGAHRRPYCAIGRAWDIVAVHASDPELRWAGCWPAPLAGSLRLLPFCG